MEPKAHHVIIGLFTVVTAAAALVFALWLGKTATDREWAWYEIGFDHPVSGLSKGNPVQYSGVEVGEVMDLTLDPDNPSHVRVLIRVDDNVKIRENTRVGLVLANITGSMSVRFRGGTSDSPIIEGSRNDPPLIMAEPSVFTSLLDNGEALLSKAERLLTNANALFSPENSENLTTILRNTRTATDGLMARRDELEDLMERMNDASVRAAEASERVTAFADNADNLLQNEGKQTLAALNSAIASIQTTATRIEQLTANNEGALDEGLQGLGELSPALRELRSTLRNLNHFTRRLEDDPTSTIWSRETIQEIPQ
ncbi:MCE family protein [Marinobacter sp. NP-4(2019)]|uniref:MlaD family protein n=1 Tax=Marinobacter sp. NP-4(2019) TaxID=2488665 RepID=UPI000FC3D115|nr:MlaD family protein [Marinobacter sp. NP-4(2019)]AZT83775.1 MCE family protein [Marinobacter sp. NP-4(2019)]